MEAGLKDIGSRTTSPDGAVTVVVGPGGVFKGTTFSERVREIAPTTLSATVQQTISAAAAQVARQQAEVLRQGIGSTELLDRVIEADQRLFGNQPLPRSPRPPGRAAAARPRRKSPSRTSTSSIVAIARESHAGAGQRPT